MNQKRALAHRALPICTLGAPGHGKTTLTAAIARVVARIGAIHTDIDGSFEAQTPMRHPIREGVGITYRAVDYETSGKFYTQIDCETQQDIVKMLVSGSPAIQGAIWIVNAVEGITPDSEALLRLASQIHLTPVIPFLNTGGIPKDDELLDICQMEMRELLSECGWKEEKTPLLSNPVRGTMFRAETAPIIIGDARKALNYKGDKLTSAHWKPIVDLVFAMNRHMPEPINRADLPLIMPIYEITEETRDSVSIQGEIVQGHLAVGQAVDVVGKGERIKTRCLGTQGAVGANAESQQTEARVEAEQDWLAVGQVLCTPKTIKSHSVFTAIVYLLTQEESSTHIPLVDNDRPALRLWGIDMPTHLQLPPDISIVTPGMDARVTVTLDLPLAMEVGTRFEVKKMGSCIGIGVVTALD